jgi:hypothetical protein
MQTQYSPKDIVRFWSAVDKNGPIPAHDPDLGPCWIWTRGKVKGYGRFHVNGRDVYAHRFAASLEWGEALPGIKTCHHCDNPPCVRPSHLFRGTHTDNMTDMARKGRSGKQVDPTRYPVGSAIKQAVLTETNVADMRQRRANGEPLADLAAAFSISVATVKRIVYGQQWRHAQGPTTNTGPRISATGERNIRYRPGHGGYQIKIKRGDKWLQRYSLPTLAEAILVRDALLKEIDA